MMRIVLRLILFLCLFACPGQATENIFSTYTLFNEKNGLSSRNIKGIQKDGDGYFWLATENDILRFDGANFIEFKPASRYFSSESVKKIIRAGHYLYIAYEEQGLIRMDLNDYSYKLITRLPLNDFNLKNENELYWITQNGIVSRLSEGNITHSVKIQGNEGQIQFFDNKVFVKRKGDPIYILRSTDLQPLKKITLPVSTNDENFEVGNNRIFYLKNKMLFGFDSTYQPVRIPAFFDSTLTSVTRYKFFNKDLQFYILNRKELWFSQKGVQQRIPMAGLMNYELRDCFVNDPENILVCSNQGLLHIRLNTGRNAYINDNVPENESKIRVRRKILETRDSTLILSGFPYTFIYGKDSVFRKLTNNIFSTYDAAIEGDWVYAATEGDGLKKINITTGQYITDTTGPLNAYDTYYTVQKSTNERELYIGGQGKIFRYDLKKDKIDVTSLPLANAVVKSIVFHPQNNICWLGTNLGLIRWTEKSNTFKVFRYEEGYGSYEVSDLMIRERQGEIWVAHNHGVDIIDIDDGKLIRQLPSYLFTNPRICSLQEDGFSRVWMSTFSGITGYDPEKETFLQLNLSNSLMNLEFNYKSAITRKNGDIVFGGLNGYDIIKPASYRFTSTRKRGLITGYQRITFDDTIFVKVNSIQPEPIDFYSDVEYLRFYLGSSDIINNSRYSFEYNFNNAPWLKVKGLPYINLVNLEPGNYRLNIRAFNEFGVPISFPEVQILSIVPFYRSPVFFISLSVISIALLLLFIITVLRLRNKEQLLKEQISMDLHDEVGTILTRALYVSKNPHDKNSIRQLHNYLDDALYSLRVYIHSMNRRSYDIQELHDEINDMLSVTFRSEHVNLDFSFSHDNDYNIRGSMFRDIKLCLYEIINNALKHADGDHVKINLLAKNSMLHLSIVDDGKLNDLKGIEERGNGIGNLRKRVERNKGNIHFSIRQPMGGLVIDIEFPLSK